MCNLYTERKSPAEVAAHFGVATPLTANVGGEVYPGGTGLVVREADGQRVLETMTWGWPMKFKFMSDAAKPKAVNNIAELSKWPWRDFAAKPAFRCLIPLTGFAEAEGPKGKMTRTWFNVRDQPLFAWAGLWCEDRKFDWGTVYSGVMTNCKEAIRPIHDRMPVLLMPDEYDTWLHGSFDDAVALKDRCFPDSLIEMTRTAELWSRPKTARVRDVVPPSL
jgi:putative SOS response-associated peptidase YedK